jgi:membrane-associated phospholipid phosphatase
MRLLMPAGSERTLISPAMMERVHAPSTASPAGAALLTAVRARERPLAWAALALLAVTLLGLVLAKTGVLARVTWEDVLAARRRYPAGLLDLADAVAFLAKPVVAGLTVLAAALVTARRHGPRPAALVVASAAVVGVSTLLKHSVGPVTSLPSGHAAYATAVFGLLACLTLYEGRRGGAAALAAIPVAMAFARVVEGAHEPVDVIGGVTLGLAWLIGLLLLWSRTDHIGPRASAHPRR